MRQSIWELRGRYGDVKKSKSSPEYTETIFSSEVCSMTHKRLENSDNEVARVADLPASMSFSDEVDVYDDIPNRAEEDTPSETVTKVIGNLPIAVYEGSPRRYGLRHVENNYSHPQLPSAQSLLASPSVYPPRPGFPQRVVCTPSETNTDSGTSNVGTPYLEMGATELTLSGCRTNCHLLHHQPQQHQQLTPSIICTSFQRLAKFWKSFSSVHLRKRRTA